MGAFGEIMTAELSVTSGLGVVIPTTFIPLGTQSTSATKPVTAGKGVEAVAQTTEKLSFWDLLSKAGEKINATELINKYVDGKITKEIINDGVPVYDTRGNPIDTPGAKVLADATAEKQKTSTYLWIGGGVLLGLGLLIYALKK